MLNQVTLYFKWLILTAVLLSEPTHTLVFYPHLTIMTFTTYAAIFKQLIQEQYVLSLDKAGFFWKAGQENRRFCENSVSLSWRTHDWTLPSTRLIQFTRIFSLYKIHLLPSAPRFPKIPKIRMHFSTPQYPSPNMNNDVITLIIILGNAYKNKILLTLEPSHQSRAKSRSVSFT